LTVKVGIVSAAAKATDEASKTAIVMRTIRKFVFGFITDS